MSGRDFDLIAVDVETSGVGRPHPVYNKSGQRFALLSIGAVRLSDFQTFYSEIGHDCLTVTPESLQVNGLNVAHMNPEPTKFRKENLPSAGAVDGSLVEWLKSDPMYREGKKYACIPVGFNVGSFDMQFVREWLPESSGIFGYRSMDLNALLFDEAIRKGQSFSEVKRQAKEVGHIFAIDHFGERKPHNALYDAWVAMGAYHSLHGADVVRVGEARWEGGNLDG